MIFIVTLSAKVTILKDTDAVIIKWIPSVQRIQVDKVVSEFYLKLVQNGMPILCHVGPEHTFAEGMRQKKYNHFSQLEEPLNEHVKVIFITAFTATAKNRRAGSRML